MGFLLSSTPKFNSPAPCRLQGLHEGGPLGPIKISFYQKSTDPYKPFLKLWFSHIREENQYHVIHSFIQHIIYYVAEGHLQISQGKRGHREKEQLTHFKTTTYVLLPSALYSFITHVPSTRKAHSDKQTHTDRVFHTQS